MLVFCWLKGEFQTFKKSTVSGSDFAHLFEDEIKFKLPFEITPAPLKADPVISEAL